MDRKIVLKAQGLSKKVSSPEGELTIVDDVSLEIAAGETVALVGASGAGKSTLLAMLAGLDVPTSGHVWLDGQDLTQMSEDARARLRADRVGFVFQAFHLVPSLTALENVMLPLELSGRRDARDSARAMLQRVGLGSRGGHYPRQLSGGEQQRVALARASVVQACRAVCRRAHGQSRHRDGRQHLPAAVRPQRGIAHDAGAGDTRDSRWRRAAGAS